MRNRTSWIQRKQLYSWTAGAKHCSMHQLIWTDFPVPIFFSLRFSNARQMFFHKGDCGFVRSCREGEDGTKWNFVVYVFCAIVFALVSTPSFFSTITLARIVYLNQITGLLLQQDHIWYLHVFLFGKKTLLGGRSTPGVPERCDSSASVFGCCYSKD